MKLKSTRTLIKSFLINPKIKLSYPITSMVNQWESVIIFMHMDKLGESPFESFGVRQMDTVLSAIDVYDEPNIEIQNNNIIISTDSDKQEIRTASNELNALIKEPKYGALQNIETNTAVFEQILNVNISKEDLAKKLKTQKLFSLETFKIGSENGESYISVCNINGDINENEAKSIIEGTGNGSIIFNVDDISSLPVLNYNIKVYKNIQNGSQISVWRIPEIPEVEIIVTEKQ